jgi:hypothetical protein
MVWAASAYSYLFFREEERRGERRGEATHRRRSIGQQRGLRSCSPEDRECLRSAQQDRDRGGDEREEGREREGGKVTCVEDLHDLIFGVRVGVDVSLLCGGHAADGGSLRWVEERVGRERGEGGVQTAHLIQLVVAEVLKRAHRRSVSSSGTQRQDHLVGRQGVREELGDPLVAELGGQGLQLGWEEIAVESGLRLARVFRARARAVDRDTVHDDATTSAHSASAAVLERGLVRPRLQLSHVGGHVATHKELREATSERRGQQGAHLLP